MQDDGSTATTSEGQDKAMREGELRLPLQTCM
jgi:hypothetical protein